MKRLSILACTLVLAACATATPYQAAEDAEGFGYSEQRLESNRYRITFLGSSATPLSTVEDYMLLRAAEMTLFNGYDWFVIAGRYAGEEGQRREPRVGVGVGVGSGGHSGFSIGISQTVFGGGGEARRAQADIVMYRGETPSDRPDAFDAEELAANLRPLAQAVDG